MDAASELSFDERDENAGVGSAKELVLVLHLRSGDGGGEDGGEVASFLCFLARIVLLFGGDDGGDDEDMSCLLNLVFFFFFFSAFGRALASKPEPDPDTVSESDSTILRPEDVEAALFLRFCVEIVDWASLVSSPSDPSLLYSLFRLFLNFILLIFN